MNHDTLNHEVPNHEIKDSLWDFACGLYADPSIKEQCLDLQDVYNADVTLILWLCWIDAADLGVRRADLPQAQGIVAGVNRELLTGLRELRSQLIASSSFTRVQEQLIRKHILSAELAIEKVLLQRLQDLTARLVPSQEEEELLSLFDYLETLDMDNCGEVSALFLERSRAFVGARAKAKAVGTESAH